MLAAVAGLIEVRRAKIRRSTSIEVAVVQDTQVVIAAVRQSQ